MIDKWIAMRYRDFYDLPRAFIVEFEGELLFFDCPFNDETDDYATEFTVYRVDGSLREQIDTMSWVGLCAHGQRVGAVPVGVVEFDETRRKAVNSAVFALIGL